MKLLIVLACLFCACAANYMGMGYGMMGYGYPLMGPMMGMGHHDSMDNDMSPQYLTCSNAELLPDGTTVFAVAVSVFDKNARQSRDSMKMFNPYMSQSQERSGLSVNIEVLNTALTGTGLVAFTTKSQPESGCAFEGKGDFGSNLIHTPDDSSQGFGFGYGFGMGMGLGSSFRNDDGIIAELPITAGRVSSLTVDGLPFKSLDELAGRGVVICSSVSSDLTGFPACERPMYACCSLSYDKKDHTIDPVLDQLPDASQFPRIPARTVLLTHN